MKNSLKKINQNHKKLQFQKQKITLKFTAPINNKLIKIEANHILDHYIFERKKYIFLCGFLDFRSDLKSDHFDIFLRLTLVGHSSALPTGAAVARRPGRSEEGCQGSLIGQHWDVHQANVEARGPGGLCRL